MVRGVSLSHSSYYAPDGDQALVVRQCGDDNYSVFTS